MARTRAPEPANPTLEQQRYRALVVQLYEVDELAQEAIAEKLAISQTLVSAILRDAKQAGIGTISTARERLGLDPAFFTNPRLGPNPRWTDHVTATQESRVEYDAEVRTTLTELIAAWPSIAIGRPEIGPPPSLDEQRWLQQYSFREDRRMGIVVDAQVLLERLLTWRRQQRGKVAEGQVVDVTLRPGRIRVVDDTPRKKR